MNRTAVIRCLEALGLPSGATPDEARAAFRRIARLNHPDIDRTASARRRFVDAVGAYRRLQALGFADRAAAYNDQCRHCGRIESLLDALDGGRACADCLLGVTTRRRLLPLPLILTVRHLSVIAFYAAGLCVFLLNARQGRFDLLWLSLALFVAGGLTLARTCLRVARIQ